MRSKLTLLTTAAAFSFGLTASAALAADATGDAPGAKSDITIVGATPGNAPSGAESQAAPDQGSAATPDPGDAGAAAQGNPPASDEGGAAAQSGADDQGATGKSTEGAPSAQPPVKEGKLPSPSSSY
jgi:hypothetical protein